MKIFRNTLGTIFLIMMTPLIIYTFWFTAQYLDGSFSLLTKILQKHGAGYIVNQVSSKVFFGTQASWTIALTFILFQIALYLAIPGKKIEGPMTKSGFTPTYKGNGFTCFAITIATFVLCSFGLKLFSPVIFFKHLGELIGTMFWIGFCLSSVLFVKGMFAPSSGKKKSSGNFLYDFFWGTELYPMVFGLNIKHIVTSRISRMSWAIITISYAAQQDVYFGLSNSMLISATLQLLFISKFFILEQGHLNSVDIAHERAGYYFCGGSLVWIPFIYTSPTLYLLHHPYQLSQAAAFAIFIAGSFAIAVNYLAEKQRLMCQEKNGTLNVWGKKPAFTVAPFVSDDGKKQDNLFLASGFCGISRYFHYIPEAIAAICWTLPALFAHIYPFFFVSLLTILLFDRAHRDDLRCKATYGEAWNDHCKKVPYKIFPYIY